MSWGQSLGAVLCGCWTCRVTDCVMSDLWLVSLVWRSWISLPTSSPASVRSLNNLFIVVLCGMWVEMVSGCFFKISAEDFDKFEKLQRIDLPGNNLAEWVLVSSLFTSSPLLSLSLSCLILGWTLSSLCVLCLTSERCVSKYTEQRLSATLSARTGTMAATASSWVRASPTFTGWMGRGWRGKGWRERGLSWKES